MLCVCRTFHFDAAHSLPDYKGKCAALHGHRWTLEVEVEGTINPTTNMIVDFVILKRVINTVIIDNVDHTHLNHQYPYPTAENMVVAFVDKLREVFDKGSLPVTLSRLRLYETPDSYCEWRRQ